MYVCLNSVAHIIKKINQKQMIRFPLEKHRISIVHLTDETSRDRKNIQEDDTKIFKYFLEMRSAIEGILGNITKNSFTIEKLSPAQAAVRHGCIPTELFLIKIKRMNLSELWELCIRTGRISLI